MQCGSQWSDAQIWLRNRSAPIRDVMRFTVVYQGQLSASGNSGKGPEIADIRERLSIQFENLWETHGALQALKHEAWAHPAHDRGGFDRVGGVNLPLAKNYSPAERAEFTPNMVNLTAPIDVDGRRYTPIVRESLHLACELQILFLRQDDPGALVSQGGDLDNRIKTLLDALRVPSKDEQTRAPPKAEHTYCLMESDTLVASLDVDTDRLLFPKTDYPNEVFLVIEVSIRVLKVDRSNVCLL
jgi:hypothetical protein